MPNKAFLEITNVCNLSCSFCPGTTRTAHFMTELEFRRAAEELRGFAQYLYFHLMGEPLLHPLLETFLNIAGQMGFRVILTTNGTLLSSCEKVLLSSPALHKISISLHSHESNFGDTELDPYLQECFQFCDKASQNGIISVLRLWNLGGEDLLNHKILQAMHTYFDPADSFEDPWQPMYSGYRIRDKIFLEWGQKFDWPDPDGTYLGQDHGCLGLRDQVGVLCDGTVVPCCLDAQGTLSLGNIFETPLQEILTSPRATAIRNSLANRRATEPLCQRCGYARMRKK